MREQDEQSEAAEVRAGTVTRLLAQQKNPERVSVFIDGAFAFGLHVDLVMEHALAKGQHLDAETQQRLRAADAARRAFDVALTYLGYRARTEAEMRRRLADKGFSEAVAEATLARLRDFEYLDDAAYARDYARTRFRTKGYGPQRLRADLRRRGVPAAAIEAALAAVIEADDVLEAARRHAATRRRRLGAEPDPRKRRKKLTDALLRRGFSYDTVRQVLDEEEREE